MSRNVIHLLSTRRFLPLFTTVCFGAGNDNLFKNAMAVLIIYRLAADGGSSGQVLVTVATAMFILPFFLFSATAGQLADKLERSMLIRRIKAAEIAIVSFGAFAFFAGSPVLLLAGLFLLGAQAAFFGPLKYGILPSHLSADELIAGNGLIEAGTFLAILAGTIAGGLLILLPAGIPLVSAAMLGLAVLGWLASLFIPRAAPAAPDLRIDPNLAAETWRVARLARASRPVFLSILGISWFWLLGAVMLAELPSFTRDVLGADEGVVTLFLTLFSVGIGAGSLLCNRMLKGEISARHVPVGALFMTAFVLDLAFAGGAFRPTPGALLGASQFAGTPGAWRIFLDLTGLAVAGGIYSVPLYAILQSRAGEAERSRTIAANNIVNAFFMTVGSGVAALLLALDFTVPDVFLILAAANGVVAVYITGLLPEAVFKGLFKGILTLFFRVEVRGIEHYVEPGEPAVVVANHVSFLDGVLLGAFLPGRPMFAIDTLTAGRWWVKPFTAIIEAFPMDPTRPLATKALIKRVREGRHCVIFPEGRITVTGALMKVYEGPGMIADKAGARLVPVRIDGAEYTPFSRLGGKVRRRWFPKILITIQEPRRFTLPEEARGRRRRHMAGALLYDIMAELMFSTSDCGKTLFEALLDAKCLHGGGRAIVEDMERRPLSYRRLVLAAGVLGRRLAPLVARVSQIAGKGV